MSGTRLLDYWSPPLVRATRLACLATTFTFEADFFSQDCLSRFLSLSTVTSEGDRISSVAALLEEEDRLSEAQVSVLVDRSSPAEKRNLRWDLLPIRAPGGLLHAKVAVLLWERAARVILGSANLTSAGYRRQIEVALALDLNEGCRVPRVVDGRPHRRVAACCRNRPGPHRGSEGAGPRDARLVRCPRRIRSIYRKRTQATYGSPWHRRGQASSPLDRLSDVWRGSQPLRATVLSPFWDGAVPAPALDAIRRTADRPACQPEEHDVARGRSPRDRRPSSIVTGCAAGRYRPRLRGTRCRQGTSPPAREGALVRERRLDRRDDRLVERHHGRIWTEPPSRAP